MAKTNYQYEKRQKNIAKKKKQDEKRLKKFSKNSRDSDDATQSIVKDAETDEVVEKINFNYKIRMMHRIGVFN